MTIAVVCAIRFPRFGVATTDPGISAIGGGERYPTALASALGRFAKTDLIVFGEPSRGGMITAVRMKLDDPAVPRKGIRVHMVRAARRLIYDYDVVHFVQDNEFAALTALIARVARKGRVYLTPVGGGRPAGLNRLRVSEAFTSFLTISHFSADAYLWLQRTSRPIHVIYGGGDTLTDDRSVAGPVGRREHVLFVGRVLPHKGVDVLLRALPQDMPAVIAGPTIERDYFEHLKSLVSARNLRVRFENQVDDRRLLSLYESARVTVLPSVEVNYRGERRSHPELLGLVLLEAMWHGSPIIGSRLGAMSEIIRADYGFLVPPGDAHELNELLCRFREPRLVNDMGRAARSMARERYSWDAVAKRALRVYGSNERGEEGIVQETSAEPEP